MNKQNIIFLVVISIFLFVTAGDAVAAGTSGGYWFRYMSYMRRYGRPVGRCYQFTLNEQLIAKPINGETGAGCKFNVEVQPAGEWTQTGGFEDTPPYAWEEDVFYEGGRFGESFSFTCSQPDITLGTLPNFLILEREEVIPSGGPGPNSKKYYFSVKDDGSVDEGDSFNLNFSFSTNCTMKVTGGGAGRDIRPMHPVEPTNERSCRRWPVTEINPRVGQVTLPITVGESCAGPTVTPTPTPTSGPQCGQPCNPDNPGECPQECPLCPPEAENPVCQPGPTATPTGPAAPPTEPAATVTPEGELSCNCDGMDITGEIAKGNTVTVTTWAKVVDPERNKAEVRYMQFYAEKDGVPLVPEDPTPTPIEASGPVRVYDPEGCNPDEGNCQVIDRYSAQWAFTIPDSGNYHIWTKITCGRRLGSQVVSNLGERGREQQGIFSRLMKFFGDLINSLFRGGDRVESTTTTAVVNNSVEMQAAIPTVTVVAPTDRTLQLGTFHPDSLLTPSPTPSLRKACKDIWFTVE